MQKHIQCSVLHLTTPFVHSDYLQCPASNYTSRPVSRIKSHCFLQKKSPMATCLEHFSRHSNSSSCFSWHNNSTTFVLFLDSPNATRLSTCDMAVCLLITAGSSSMTAESSSFSASGNTGSQLPATDELSPHARRCLRMQSHVANDVLELWLEGRLLQRLLFDISCDCNTSCTT